MKDKIVVLTIAFYTIVFLLHFGEDGRGQNIAINTTGALPDSSAALDIDFPDKGLLIPRVALTAANSNAPIGTNVITSLLVYNTATVNDVTPGYYYWNGTAWVRLLSIGSSAGTTDYLARWTSTTNLGIGITRDNGTYVGIGSAPSTNYRLFVSSANGSYDGIYGEHTSGASGSVFNAVSGKIVNGTYTTAQGYLAYHVSNNNTYAVYGKGGNWAGYFDNKVVIGNSTPGSVNTGDLEVQNTTAGSGNAATLMLRQTTSNATSGNVLSNINFGDNYQSNPQAQIQVLRGAASGGVTDLPTDILFYTINDNSAILSERMRISYSGNIGIGTSSPDNTLTVGSPTGLTGYRITTNGTANGILAGGTTIGGYFRAYNISVGDKAVWAEQVNSSGFSIYAEGGKNYFQGNVGVGITSPSRNLEVLGGANGTETVLAEFRSNISGTNTGGSVLRLSNTDVSSDNNGTVELAAIRTNSTFNGDADAVFRTTYNNGTVTERMRILANGNVGIGSTSPGQKLTVDGTVGILETGASPSKYTTLQGGDQSADITYTLPTAQGGASTVLKNDGTGTLSWGTDGTEGTTVVCGSSNTCYINIPHWAAFSIVLGSPSTSPAQIALCGAVENDASIRIYCAGDKSIAPANYAYNTTITTFGAGNCCSLVNDIIEGTQHRLKIQCSGCGFSDAAIVNVHR